MRLTHTINLGLLLLLWIGSAWVYPQLSERIPVHFGASGAPDRWESTSPLSWFALPLVATALVAFTYVVARILPSRPGWVNLPQKERYRALPDDRKQPVIAQVQRLLWGSTTLMLVLFCAIQMASYEAAQGRSSQGLILVVLLLAVLSTPLILGLWLPPVQRELDRQAKAHEAEQRERTERA